VTSTTVNTKPLLYINNECAHNLSTTKCKKMLVTGGTLLHLFLLQLHLHKILYILQI